MIPDMGYHFMNPAMKGFDVTRPPILVYRSKGVTQVGLAPACKPQALEGTNQRTGGDVTGTRRCDDEFAAASVPAVRKPGYCEERGWHVDRTWHHPGAC
jgi:hypothetical protein